MALMTWLYWAYFIFLAGGELNAELLKASGGVRHSQQAPTVMTMPRRKNNVAK
jgi:uncharacterized BrkB/YihY/UPF0761 family membrane protein